MKKTVFAAVLAVLLGAHVAREASAHIVPVGVGTQTWIEVRPRKLIVRFNLGFASLRAVDEFKLANTQRETAPGSHEKISHEEEKIYLEGLARRVLPRLQFHLDGKPIEMHVTASQAAGLFGEVSAVAFDTFFDLEADVAVGPGPHELTYLEGTFQGEVSQQILHVVTDHSKDFASFDVEQKTQGPPPTEEYGALTLQGRDVTMRFEFLGHALERDKAEALIEPCMAGLQGTLDQLATNVARSAEQDLSGFPLGKVRLGVEQPSLVTTARSGFNVSAPTAGDRDARKNSSSALSSLRNEENEEGAKMQVELLKPFTLATLFFFLVWGALHATGPGHGKGMVAAYLIGTKGRVWDAVRLGLIVTFTHTFVLYTLGLGLVAVTEWLRITHASKDALMQKTIFLISFLSGVGLFLFGLALAYRRSGAKAHSHDHGHSHAPIPEKLEAPKTGKKLGLVMAAPIEVAPEPHSHDGHTHSHGGHSHSHDGMSEDEHSAAHAREAATEITSFKDLLVLGVQGGIVPCPAGVTLILFAIAKEQSALKTFMYLNAFSLGLGVVLVSIASAMVFSRTFLEHALTAKRKRALDALPVLSAILVSFVGLAIVYESFDPNYARAWKKLTGIVSTASPKDR
ncbi:MAG: nickel/cobalt transporter [Planctomycetota bacterium]